MAVQPVGKIPSLDGLRAASVALVAFSHAAPEGIVPGGFGVTVFFFLSGFLITTLMRAERDATGAVSLRDFWIRRALRILPPFYVVLVAAAIVGFAFEPPGAVTWPALAAQALHVTNYWIVANGYEGLPAGTAVYWSLAVEEHFYLLFPFLFIALRRARLSGRSQAYVLWGLCAAVLAWRTVLVLLLNEPEARTYHATDTRVDSILFGCALAVWRNPVLDDWGPDERAWKLFVVPVALAVLLACFVYRDPIFRETIRYSLQGVALTVIFIAAIRFTHWGPVKLLNLRPVVFIGMLSYSLYLVHYPMLFAVERMLPEAGLLVRAAIGLPASVLVSWLIWVLVERPCARLRRRFAHAPG
jgi:peptidoglycan/LPS O-acetylase OafA/YrhL